MDVVIPVKNIKYASSVLSTIANIRSAFIQPYIRISAGYDRIDFSATSYEIAARISFEDVEIYNEGESLVNASSLNGFVSRLHESDNEKVYSDPVHITKKSGKIQLETKTHYHQGDTVDHRVRLEEVDSSVYPDPFSVNERDFVSIDGLFVREGLDKTGYAMSTDDATAPVFRGVHFKSDSSSLQLTSTDGKELARYMRELSLPIFNEVLSATLVSILTKYANPVSEVYFYFQNGKMFVRSDNLTLMGSTIVNDFPDVDRVLSPENYKHFLVSKSVLQDNILNVMPNVDSKSNRIGIRVGKERLTIRGEYSNETINTGVKVYGFDGEFSFDCNGWYLHRAISKIESDMVKILFREPETPIIIKDNEEQSFDLTTLIVPMRKI